MSDHFDRLVARAAPAAAPAGGADGGRDAGVVRVRPRLPGPFERMDAFGARVEPLGPDTGERQWAEPAGRTEEMAVRRTPVEDMPRTGPVQPVLQHLPLVLREQTAPRHGVLTAAVAQPAAAPATRPAGRAAGDATRDDSARRSPSTGRQLTELTVRHDAAEARRDTGARPTAVPAQTARPAARPAEAAAGRRSARDSARQHQRERTVHISIARLEVRAVGRRNDAAARPRERAQQPGRQSPVLSLEKYLSRGEAQR
ncbi:hypothetical protein [Streptomyces sp. CoH27]|uniref:hypothetical protein n=1 Tax=Streptomyces sp. CoH27 TaxID=2875763 RepID=UPI001CD50CA7|nr:hypothetical protein [Streptomyces sp. CoH27]